VAAQCSVMQHAAGFLSRAGLGSLRKRPMISWIGPTGSSDAARLNVCRQQGTQIGQPPLVPARSPTKVNVPRGRHCRCAYFPNVARELHTQPDIGERQAARRRCQIQATACSARPLRDIAPTSQEPRWEEGRYAEVHRQ